MSRDKFEVDEDTEFNESGRPLPKEPYYTVAVRFLRGPNPGKAYTYRVPKKAKVHLGQEVVVPTTLDGFTALTVAVVVEIHRSKEDNGPYDYKFVAGTVKPL